MLAAARSSLKNLGRSGHTFYIFLPSRVCNVRNQGPQYCQKVAATGSGAWQPELIPNMFEKLPSFQYSCRFAAPGVTCAEVTFRRLMKVLSWCCSPGTALAMFTMSPVWWSFVWRWRLSFKPFPTSDCRQAFRRFFFDMFLDGGNPPEMHRNIEIYRNATLIMSHCCRCSLCFPSLSLARSPRWLTKQEHPLAVQLQNQWSCGHHKPILVAGFHWGNPTKPRKPRRVWAFLRATI